MEIILGKTAGFCGGVCNAVEKTKQELAKRKNKITNCLGELVHNKVVIKSLEKQGLKIIDQIEQAKDVVIIRAHGIPKETYVKIKKKNIELLDLTCKKVLKIHQMAEEYEKQDFYLFLIGNKQHPEVIGTFSFCGKNCDKIENKEDMLVAIENFKISGRKKLAILAQTTFSMEKFKQLTEIVREKVDDTITLKIENTICNATKLRQEETKQMSKTVDGMIIIGGKNSSNTNKLYEIAKENCSKVILVETEIEIDRKEIQKWEKIGIMAGASTPKESIDKVVEYIQKK